MEDSRFKKFSSDPRYMTVPKKEKKIKIDPRFKEVFKEKFAGPSRSVDKRGKKKLRGKGNEDLKRFYSLEDSSSSDEEDESDFARGKAVLTDSSSGESDSESESEETFDKWGELDCDAERNDEDPTCRLAVCNMDWDRINAKDLYLALSSFLPASGGTIKSVNIYLSDYGAERLKEDDYYGPEEIRKNRKKELSESEMNERIRQYQINRLKYYYAVAEFDSPKCSLAVYEECDGMEFELSACRFDLRFIPDDIEFNEREPHEICDSPPTEDVYEPKAFETTALQKGKVELTWDETDPKRVEAMQKAFDENNDDALREYINQSDDDEYENEEREMEEIEDEDDAVEKYRALLADIRESDKRKEEDKGNMQITWNPSVEKNIVQEKKDLTPWEEYLKKRRDKQRLKREHRKLKLAEGKEAFSDDEVPEGFDDPFFDQDPLDEVALTKQKSKKKKSREEVDPDLELIVMDERDDNKKHFDYKEIVKRETTSQKKRKKKNKEQDKEQADIEFSLDLQDSRFQAIFDDPDYNVDPSHPNFKKTKSMKAVIEERQKRILESDERHPPSKKPKAAVSEIDSLVKSVQLNARAKKKKSQAIKK